MAQSLDLFLALNPPTPHLDKIARLAADFRAVDADIAEQADLNRLCGAPVTFEPMSVERRQEIEAEEEACERDDARIEARGF